jgi:methylated-DNA-protein-cysteine methyltransferase-like protein
MGKNKLYARIYEIVNHIPRGKVATYGQIAGLAGMPGHARQVGYALHSLPEGSGVPWQRVINRKGQISLRAYPSAEHLQRALLEAEGIVFDEQETITLGKYQWHTPRPSRGTGSRRGVKPARRIGEPAEPTTSDRDTSPTSTPVIRTKIKL